MSETKRETAARLGYGDDVTTMDMDHDALHGALCHFLGVPSYSLKAGRGEALSERERHLAEMEEAAVLAAQGWRQLYRNHLTKEK